MIFGFGLFHGLGFGEQMKFYLADADFGIGLAGFTIGVELGQLFVLATSAAVAFAVKIGLKRFGHGVLYRNAFVRPVAALIALIGLYWFFQRLGIIPGGD